MTLSGEKSVEWEVENGEWRTLVEQRDAACRLLERLAGEPVTVGHDDKGAPYSVEYPDLHISISHCRKAVAVAISKDGPVGIDVECRRRVGEGLLERVCNEAEQVAVRTSKDPTMEFLRLWTCKEAVLKMRGTGIQGFGSMVTALDDDGVEVKDLPCSDSDIVAAMAVIKDE